MSQVFIILSTVPEEVVSFYQSLCSEYPDGTQTALYVPEGLIRKEGLTTYPSPDTEWNIPEASEKIFFIYIDPRVALIEALDAIADGLQDAGLIPNRVITIIDCKTASESGKLRDYYEACIFHSDIALLAQRETVSKKWVNEYIKAFEKKAIPTVLTFLKKNGKVDNPKYMLYPETLRLSQLFDYQSFEEGPLPFEVEASFDINNDSDDINPDPYRIDEDNSPPDKRVPNVESLINYGNSA